MDLTRPVTYRGASLNNPIPTVGKPGIAGCMVERAEVYGIDYTGFAEKRRVADGMDAIEPYVALHKMSLSGTVFGKTRGEAYDALQVLRHTFSPTEALRQSPTTKGFLPIAFTDSIARTLDVRPMGLHWQWASQRQGTNAKVAGMGDAVALGIRWSAELLVGYASFCLEFTEETLPSCPVQVSTVWSTTGWDSGFIGPTPTPSPITFHPLVTLPQPGIVLALFFTVNHTEPVGGVGGYGGPGIQTVSGDFTEWGDSRQNYPTDYPSLALAGYQHVAAGETSGLFTVAWSPSSGSGAHRTRVIAGGFYTHATAPVQVAPYQDGSGSTVVFPNPLTPGNVIILAKVSETGDFSPPNPPTGFTLLNPPGDAGIPGLGTHHLEFCMKCVNVGDSQTVGVGDVAWSHWAFASEWAIT